MTQALLGLRNIDEIAAETGIPHQRLEELRGVREPMAKLDRWQWIEANCLRLDVSARFARQLLSRLDTRAAVDSERLADGKCDDCGVERPRFRYGRMAVCEPCYGRRAAAVLAQEQCEHVAEAA